MVLSYDQAPPLSVPLRFFLTAPMFGAACGAVVALSGSGSFAEPTAGATLAVVHLYTAGFMLQAMIGAMLQLLPVAAGGIVWRPLWVARGTHLPTAAGGAALAFAMATGSVRGYQVAVAGLAGGGLVFLAGVIPALRLDRMHSSTLAAMRLAVLALAVAVALGCILALGLSGVIHAPAPSWLTRHAAVGLVGWGLMLVLAVAFVIVPMFEMTPSLPAAVQSSAPWLLFVAVAVAIVPGTAAAAAAVLSLPAAAVAVALWRQFDRRRRRPRHDGTRFWRFALASLAGSACMAPIAAYWRVDGLWWLCGALLLHGFFGSLIVAMLYRILPFLLWLHAARAAQRRPGQLGPVPAWSVDLQFALHAAALLLLMSMPWLPTRVAGGATLFASHVWLLWVHGRRVALSHNNLKPDVATTV